MTVTYTVIGTIAVGRIEAVTEARLNELSALRVCIIVVLEKRLATLLLEVSERAVLTSCSEFVSRRM